MGGRPAVHRAGRGAGRRQAAGDNSWSSDSAATTSRIVLAAQHQSTALRGTAAKMDDSLLCVVPLLPPYLAAVGFIRFCGELQVTCEPLPLAGSLNAAVPQPDPDELGDGEPAAATAASDCSSGGGDAWQRRLDRHATKLCRAAKCL